MLRQNNKIRDIYPRKMLFVYGISFDKEYNLSKSLLNWFDKTTSWGAF